MHLQRVPPASDLALRRPPLSPHPTSAIRTSAVLILSLFTFVVQRVPPASDLAPPAPASLVAPVAPPEDLDTVDDRWFGFLQNGEGVLKGGQEHLSCKVWNSQSDAVDGR